VTVRGTPTPLARELLQRIRAQGRIPFAEFMRQCLYHPAWGYYSRAEARRFADFYTSVDVHPIFARLLARQLAEMWDRLGCPEEFWAVEAAAGTGRLAAQFLDFAARDLGKFYRAMRYVAVESSAARRAAHAAALAPHLSAGRACSAAELPSEMDCGCIFSNELLDALPVHRVVVERGELREIYVGCDGEVLREELGPLSTPEIEAFFREQDVTLREGQQAEAGLDACRWLAEAGARLGRGFVLTVDYGHEAADFTGGTIAARCWSCASHGERGLSAFSRRAGFDGAREFYRAGAVGTALGPGTGRVRHATGVFGSAGPRQRLCGPI
jgi:SAM-dependent MidA family methyltransferase